MDWDSFYQWAQTPNGQEYIRNFKEMQKTPRVLTRRYPKSRSATVGIFKSADPDPGDAQPAEHSAKDWLALPVKAPDTKRLDAWLLEAIRVDPGEQDRLLILLKTLNDVRKARLAKVAGN